MVTCCSCWNSRKKNKQLNNSSRLKRSRSLEKVDLSKYTILEDKYQPAPDSDKDLEDNFANPGVLTHQDNFNMGNSLSPESLEAPKETASLRRQDSSVSLKSSSSTKSASSRRSKVTFTEHNPEVHMIPPKSPPKPKRTKNKQAIYDDVECLVRDEESESAFQFDLSNKAELTSIEDLSAAPSKNSSKKSKKDKATEDSKVIESDDFFVVC